MHITSLFLLLASFVAVQAASLFTRDSDSQQQPSGYWYEYIEHNGISPFINGSSTYSVYRNVKDYGAKGDGVTDDTTAIQNAINADNRGPAGNGRGTTGQPASVYFPSGTYLVNNTIQMYVDTVLIGNPVDRPVIKAASYFQGDLVINGFDPGFGTGGAPVNFYIEIKNFVFDSTAVPNSTPLVLLDWAVSQATLLTNVLFDMPVGSQHTGVSTIEGGSGTFFGNLEFVGGAIGINMNNQQFNLKDMTFTNCGTGLLYSHGFAMVFQGFQFYNCGIGINATAPSFGNVGSFVLLDSEAVNTNTIILTKSHEPNVTTTPADDSVVIENLRTTGCANTVVAGSSTILTGSVPNVWVYGNSYTSKSNTSPTIEYGTTYYSPRSGVLLDNTGKYFTMAPPTYQEYPLQSVINVKTVPGLPVAGDGVTDDTKTLQAILQLYALRNVILFFPAGTYIVTDTLFVPSGSRLIGEVWSAISANGSNFADSNNPRPMVRVGNPGDRGVAQFSDMLFTVADVLEGCILFEVNMAGVNPGDVATWNTHFRVGGAAGSKVETACQNALCKAAFLMLHLTPTASIYIEDMWGWTADHDLDNNYNQLISTGRGALIEATQGTWLVGTAFEHNTLYEYNLVNAANVYAGMQQSETPYWQGYGGPAQAPAPWTPNPAFVDPTFDNCSEDDPDCRMSWYEIVNGGSNLYLYGSGFWTFFNALGSCEGPDGYCQTNAVTIEGNPERLYWWNLNTRGSYNMVVDDGVDLALANDNSGSWGSVAAAVLSHA